MNSKVFFVASMAALLPLGARSAEQDIIVLDLSKSTTPLTFNSVNGAWTGTYDDDETEIESQVFSFVHNSMGDYNTWWGFTASNSANRAQQTNYLVYQFSNMGLGGIELNEDGTIKTDKFGAPVTSSSMPYLVSFASSGFARHPADMTFTDDRNYEVIGAYFNLNSYAYYTIEDGDNYARAFTDGDRFTLTVHGIAPDETEKTVDVVLASYDNGNLTINRGWTYVDLSDLGVVNQIWFSLKSTDSGIYGDNTPSYFCMDKLMVRPVESNGAAEIVASRTDIRYNRANREIVLGEKGFAMVYDQTGRCVMTSDEADRFSVAHLAPGVYIVKCGNSKIKITR